MHGNGIVIYSNALIKEKLTRPLSSSNAKCAAQRTRMESDLALSSAKQPAESAIQASIAARRDRRAFACALSIPCNAPSVSRCRRTSQCIPHLTNTALGYARRKACPSKCKRCVARVTHAGVLGKNLQGAGRNIQTSTHKLQKPECCVQCDASKPILSSPLHCHIFEHILHPPYCCTRNPGVASSETLRSVS